jgi:hypothetical protein
MRVVSSKLWILGLVSAMAVSVLYVTGYFIVVQKRLRNPFISWPIMRPLPMVEYYSPAGLKALYEPVVRLDQKMFPKRWQCPPTPKEQYPILCTTTTRRDFYNMLVAAGSPR